MGLSSRPWVVMDSFSVISASPEQTDRIGALVAQRLGPGDAVLLNGDLAAGKTRLVKAIAAALGSNDLVTSPTFALAQFYAAEQATILHIDTYRLSGVEEYRDLALEDYAADAVDADRMGVDGRVRVPGPSVDPLRVAGRVRAPAHVQLAGRAVDRALPRAAEGPLMTTTLAIETSSVSYGVAVGVDGAVVAERTLRRDDPAFTGLADLVATVVDDFAVDRRRRRRHRPRQLGLGAQRRRVREWPRIQPRPPILVASSLELLALEAARHRPDACACATPAAAACTRWFDGELRHGPFEPVVPVAGRRPPGDRRRRRPPGQGRGPAAGRRRQGHRHRRAPGHDPAGGSDKNRSTWPAR